MKTEVGGQREERKIEAYPVSCLSRRPSPYTNHQSANNNSGASVLFTAEQASRAKDAVTTLKHGTSYRQRCCVFSSKC